MKKTTLWKEALPVVFLIFMTLITATLSAQERIATVTRDASSVLDLSSTTQGLLAARMTACQKTVIVATADGFLVYDTSLRLLSCYNSTTLEWNTAAVTSSDRLKFKIIKSADVLAIVLAAEKTAGDNTKCLLDFQTLYKINAAINANLPMN
jgi:hypothetical protein